MLLLYFIAGLSSFSMVSDSFQSVGFNLNDKQLCVRGYEEEEDEQEQDYRGKKLKKRTGTYIEGKMAGEEYASSGGVIEGFAGGFCCGIGGAAYPLLSSKDIPNEARKMLEGKSEEYQRGFYDGYKSKKSGNAWGGCLAGALIAAVLIIFLGGL